jgi:hypothetical protein
MIPIIALALLIQPVDKLVVDKSAVVVGGAEIGGIERLRLEKVIRILPSLGMLQGAIEGDRGGGMLARKEGSHSSNLCNLKLLSTKPSQSVVALECGNSVARVAAATLLRLFESVR